MNKSTIQAVLIGSQQDLLLALQNEIKTFCPSICIHKIGCSLHIIEELDDDMEAKLVFIDLNILSEKEVLPFLRRCHQIDLTTIVFFQSDHYALDAIKACASGYLLLPISKEDLLVAVENARKKIELEYEMVRQRELVEQFRKYKSNQDLIGIPTLDGFDFFRVDNIMRCEGLQKCTRVITKNRTNIVSSYNIGEFRKILEPYGFFSPHKSFLINLDYIKKYSRIGTIIMLDDVPIPVSRNRKNHFLERMIHL